MRRWTNIPDESLPKAALKGQQGREGLKGGKNNLTSDRAFFRKCHGSASDGTVCLSRPVRPKVKRRDGAPWEQTINQL